MLGTKLPGTNSNEERPSRRDFLLGIGLASALALPIVSAPARAAVSMLRTGLDPDLVETESSVIPAGKRGGGKGRGGGGKGRGGGGKGRGGGGKHHGGGGKHHGGGGKHHGGGGKHHGGGGKHHGGGGKHHGGKHHNGRWHNGRWYAGHGRYWHGRWYDYGVGACWRFTPTGWIWVCY
jgi:hypothetical protein